MKKEFNAKISKLLHLTTHAVYSDKSMAVRELISNASDACNKLRVKMLQEGHETVNFKIDVEIDKENGLLSIYDNGVGMDILELESNLGPIAESGTEQAALDDKTADKDLIGRFGIGFYSAFMIAKSVRVISKKYGESKTCQWQSNGYDGFDVSEVEDPAECLEVSGTKVVLEISDEKFLDKGEISNILEKHSYHIQIPIHLLEKGADVSEHVNKESSIWRERNLGKKKMAAFYKANYYTQNDPIWSMHTFAEGGVEYTALLFAPHGDAAQRYYTTRDACNIKLYAKGVLIQDDFKDMLPPFLRFIEGVVDCYDIDLNISREILQKSNKINKVKESLIKKVLKSLSKAKNFEEIKKHYGPLIKEGICDFQYQKEVLKMMSFGSSMLEEAITLDQYITNMIEDQSDIYYIYGHDKDVLMKSPQVVTLQGKGINTLILTDTVDEIWVVMLGQYEGKQLKSATNSNEAEVSEEMKPLIDAMEKRLPPRFKSVTISENLADIPTFASQDSESANPLTRMMNTNKSEDVKYKLEVNPNHIINKKLAKIVSLEAESTQEKSAYIIDSLIFMGLAMSNNQWKNEEISLLKSMEKVLDSVL